MTPTEPQRCPCCATDLALGPNPPIAHLCSCCGTIVLLLDTAKGPCAPRVATKLDILAMSDLYPSITVHLLWDAYQAARDAAQARGRN